MGFHGKTISCMISNFSAEVEIDESKVLQILPHPRFTPFCFLSLDDLTAHVQHEGYYGGIRLFLASCRRFRDACRQLGVELGTRNFSLRYNTTIPRQVGLAGSSAIVTAALQAPMEFHGLTARDIPPAIQPSIALAVETEELDIAAGLQDRVVQAYGGLVYMDFDRGTMETTGHGTYEPLDMSLLPRLYLAYDRQGTDSGRTFTGQSDCTGRTVIRRLWGRWSGSRPWRWQAEKPW